jgi:hypothetical protein
MEKHGEINPFYTTSDFWDCECKEGRYIHAKYVAICHKCGAKREDSPDSRMEEIDAALDN